MFGNPKAERRALELTYEDVCLITRLNPIEINNIASMQQIQVYSGKCALSKNVNRSDQTEAQQNVAEEMVLFVAPEPIVTSGDKVEVNRLSRMDLTYNYEVIGKPFYYATHQEIRLRVVKVS